MFGGVLHQLKIPGIVILDNESFVLPVHLVIELLELLHISFGVSAAVDSQHIDLTVAQDLLNLLPAVLSGARPCCGG